jgi:16S rRNA (guanine(1405)-N(7))-methyltransferase
MENPSLLDELVNAVLSKTKYHAIDPGLIRWVGDQELKKRRSLKEAVKATHSRLHQIGSAFQESKIDYPFWRAKIESLPQQLDHPDLQQACLQMMALHASTQERLPILDNFYKNIFSELEPIHSVMDLACGFNPFALSWMPLPADAGYYCCDIYSDLVELVNRFLIHTHRPGYAFLSDLTHHIPTEEVDLALFLKAIPCLDQLDKTTNQKILDSIPAKYVLVTFPVRSLGGHAKGMAKNYEIRFNQLITGRSWAVRRFEFPSELAFLIKK